MASKRIQRTEARLAAVEAAYRLVLTAALEDCAAGRWGLFGQNENTPASSRFRPKALDELDALAADINELRQKLGYGAYPLHTRFIGMRGRHGENQPGEPKLASRLLADLNV